MPTSVMEAGSGATGASVATGMVRVTDTSLVGSVGAASGAAGLSAVAADAAGLSAVAADAAGLSAAAAGAAGLSLAGSVSAKAVVDEPRRMRAVRTVDKDLASERRVLMALVR